MEAAMERGGGWDARGVGVGDGVGYNGGIGGSVDAGIGDGSGALTDSGMDACG